MEEPWGASHAESITGFAGILGAAAWCALLLNAIVTRRFRTREFFFVVVTPIILGVILGWPIIATSFHAVFKLAANARLRLLLCFISAILTAALIDMLERGAIRIYLIGIACAAALLAYLMFTVGFPLPWHKDVAMLAIIPSMIVLLIAAIAALERRFVPFVVLVAIIAELWKVDRVWNPVLPDRLMYPDTPLIAALKQRVARDPIQPCRIVGVGAVFFPNAPAVYGFEDIRAHDPMSNGRYLGTLRVTTGYDTSDYFARWENFGTRMLDFLNVCYIVGPPKGKLEDTQRYQIIYDGRDGRIFRNNDALRRFYIANNVVLQFNGERFNRMLMQQQNFADTAIVKALPVENDQERSDLLAPRPASSPRATLRLTKASDTEYDLVVDAPRYTLVASSLPYWPGWKITRNGEPFDPLTTVQGAFIGFVARPGKTRVRIYYDPLTFKIAAILSLLTLAILAAFSSESLRRRLRSRSRSE